MEKSDSARISESLQYPIIDTDGHIQEYMPAVLPYLRESLGPRLFEQYRKSDSTLHRIQHGGAGADRSQTRCPQGAWWTVPTRSVDLASALFPKLFHQRMDQFGIAYSVLFPSRASGVAGVEDEDMRRGLCAGFNEFYANAYRPYTDRLTVCGVIPMVNPTEAIEEIRHCSEIGLKVVGVPEGVLRPIPEPNVRNPSPWMFPNQTHWFDRFGMDSAFDYDPVWRELVNHRYPLMSHVGLGHVAPEVRTSTTSYVFNHLGAFANSMNTLAKSLFLGGVTNRFPELNIAFLECGVGWASVLLADLVEHWERRNIEALEQNLRPELVDWDVIAGHLADCGDSFAPLASLEDEKETFVSLMRGTEPAVLDEWLLTGVKTASDIYDRFVPRLFFGCEADDRSIGFGFSRSNAFGARLQAMFSSDIGHWDVEDATRVVAEAHGLVRKGVITEDDFRDLVFQNPVRLLCGSNPEFFNGTEIEGPVNVVDVRHGLSDATADRESQV